MLSRGRREDIRELPGGDFSVSMGINDLGEVAGSSNTARGIRAFIWTRKGAVRALGTLPGDSSSEAFAINATGDMVGYSSGRSGMRAVRWTRSGVIQALDSLPGATLSRAMAINDRGDAAGTSWSEAGKRAVLWSGGAIQNLGTLPRDSQSEAAAINNLGEVVGSSYEADGTRRAVMWAPGAAIQNLGALTGGTDSRALAINDAGQIVGASMSLLGSRAVLWIRTGGITDLNTVIPTGGGFVLTEAVAINELGMIVALGQDDHGHGPRTPPSRGPDANLSADSGALTIFEPGCTALEHVMRKVTIAWLTVLVLNVTVASVAANDVVGQWTSLQDLPAWMPHTHLLPTGKVMMWPGSGQGGNPRLWDPDTESLTNPDESGI